MGLIVLWAMMGIVVAIIANSKGFDAAGWFFYGALTGPVALTHVIVKPRKNTPIANTASAKEMLEGDTKACPDCAESIRAAAIVCRYCGKRDLPNPLTPALSEEEAWFASLEVAAPKPKPTTWQKLWWNPHTPDRRR